MLETFVPTATTITVCDVLTAIRVLDAQITMRTLIHADQMVGAEGEQMKKWSTEEIIKMIDSMVGITEPVADSALDKDIEDNLMALIDVVNWSLDGIYDAARHRKSEYESQRRVGERAYSAMLEWGDWLKEAEDDMA